MKVKKAGGILPLREKQVADLLSKGKVRIFERVQLLIFIHDNY